MPAYRSSPPTVPSQWLRTPYGLRVPERMQRREIIAEALLRGWGAGAKQETTCAMAYWTPGGMHLR